MTARTFAHRIAICLTFLVLLAPVGALAKPEHGSRAPGEGIFTVRPEGAYGPLVAYSMDSGRKVYELPPGMLAADGSRYVTATPTDAGTLVGVHEADYGQLGWRFPYDGRWDVRGISPTGQWAALVQVPSDQEKAAWTKSGRWQTAIRIIDTDRGMAAHELTLDGRFEVETISADGTSLFLIEHLPAVNPDHYLIRLYDLATETLNPNALRDKRNTDEIMAGLAWEGVASPDGRWLLTLYLNTLKDTAFIHSLDLINKYPVCIDLPGVKGDFASLKAYTLTLAPNGTTVYAANAVLGVVAEVDLTLQAVTHVTTFPPAPPAAAPDRPVSRSAISPDGSRLYFATGRTVWAYDTIAGELVGSYPTETDVAGLGVSNDGDRLFIAAKDASPAVLAIDTATGARVTLPRT